MYGFVILYKLFNLYGNVYICIIIYCVFGKIKCSGRC